MMLLVDEAVPADAVRDEAIRGLEHEIGRLLRRVRRGLAERANQVDPALSATSYPMLATLAEFGPHRAADLADMFALDKGGVSRIVHQLVDLGLVERTPDPKDGRASILAATPLAHERLLAMVGQRRQEFGAQMAGWEPDEIRELTVALARLNSTISD